MERELNEPVFHERWEARVWAILFGAEKAGAIANTDQFRHSIERIDPRAYLAHSYYGRWLGGLENLLIETGVLDPNEIESAVTARGGNPEDLIAARPGETGFVPQIPPTTESPGFAVGDPVTTFAHGVAGHTRLPAYARGKRGKVILHHGLWPYPDTSAHGHGECPQHLYTIRFDSTELWGQASEPNVSVTLDLFEPYLS